MKVAIVHDWLTNYGGAETVVELFLELYPDADVFTLVYDKKKMKNYIFGKLYEQGRIHTSSLQKIPKATKLYTKFLNFMPAAFESFDFSNYDLVICSSSSCAKGVITPPSVPHIAYVHTPMRYAWDLYFDYKKRSGKLTQHFMKKWIPNIRLWDFVSSQRIDAIVANSNYIARRIKKFWNREAEVVYPPTNEERFFADETVKREDYYVSFSRLVAYKRVDLAVSACKKLGKKLVVIGSGSEMDNLKKLAADDKNIIFAGRLSDEDVRSHLQKCKGLIFGAEEDFGITPCEAQICGCPVIAFGKGGALETVVDGETGVFFSRQETDSVCEAIARFEKMCAENVFDSKKIIEHGKTFSRAKFKEDFKKIVDRCLDSASLRST